MKIEASYYSNLGNKKIRCELCPHFCIIADQQTGRCRARKNCDGTLYAINYGQVSAINIDPIEKKPLYHFLPGSKSLSIGNNGCNLECKFCQNWEIAHTEIQTKTISPDSLTKLALAHSTPSVSFTYAEPVIWFEYIKDCAKSLAAQNIKTVLVTNGMLNHDPIHDLLPLVHAMNIDIKSMNPEFYSKLCNGSLETVLNSVKEAAKEIHIEVTNLVIPGENDTQTEFKKLRDFILSVNPDIPVHISRYHPSYKMTNSVTPLSTLQTARSILKKDLPFVYVGNVSGPGFADTVCPKCQSVVISRSGFSTVQNLLTKDGSCQNCGTRIPLIQ